MHLGVLDIEFTVLEPAELRSRVEAIADRFHRAAQREEGPPCPASAEASNQPSETAAKTRPDIRLAGSVAAHPPPARLVRARRRPAGLDPDREIGGTGRH